MDAKQPGNLLLLVGSTSGNMGGSLVQSLHSLGTLEMPRVDLATGPRTAALVASLIRQGHIASAHDCSEGGMLTAVAEMLIAGDNPHASPSHAARIGAALHVTPSIDAAAFAFCEDHSRYVLEVSPQSAIAVRAACSAANIECCELGQLNASGTLTWPAAHVDASVDDLAKAWLGTLDW
jgi:phosphoribosylformylglycinamidine (FGAM) synthase-like enzyme